jgi:Zn-dependent protease with chaperone function
LAVGRLRPAYSEFGGPWYEFEGSYWHIAAGQVKHGIDWAYQTEGRGTYGFHLLFGHHGLFSLTPVFLLGVVGAVYGLARRRGVAARLGSADDSEDKGLGISAAPLKALALLTLLVAVVVIGFYVFGVNDRNRNYGGWTSAPRWLMWLTPLLLLSALPAADWLAPRRWGRGLAYVLLALSVLSVSYPAWNPWRHPWVYNWMESQGWIPY